jgi:hypothetical protein
VACGICRQGVGHRWHLARPTRRGARPARADRRRDAHAENLGAGVGSGRTDLRSRTRVGGAGREARCAAGAHARPRLGFHQPADRAFCSLRGITLVRSPVRRPSWNVTCKVSSRWTKRRAQGAAERRGGGTLTQADLDAPETYVGGLPEVDETMRGRFLAAVAEQLEFVAIERGLALDAHLSDHERARWDARGGPEGALNLPHLTIEGRVWRKWFLGSAA